MEPSQMEKKVSELSQSQQSKIHSPFTVPFRTSDSRANDNMAETRNLDSMSLASSTQQSSTRIDLISDDSKESTGRKLLNMLRKTIKGSEDQELDVAQAVPALVPLGDVVGCLAVHIRRCRHFSPMTNLQHFTNLFIRITVNKIMKYTKTHSLNCKNNENRPEIKFEEVKYFSVQVPRRQDDGRNMIYLELMKFDHLKAYPVVLGSFGLHLYEVIQKGCFTEEFLMRIRNQIVCKVEVEFMFSYGNFGYGFSHQLKPLQKLIQPSMFMHIPPPAERTDPLTNVITPQLIEYPAFLSPDLNVTVGTQQKQTHSSSPIRLEKLQQQPRERLERMKKEYRNLKTWEEKSRYLDQILRMKTDLKDANDIDGNDAIFIKHDSPPLASFSQTLEYSLKKQEVKPLLSEFPIKTPELKKRLPLAEMREWSPDLCLNLQGDAETKNESLPSPLPPVSLREKEIRVDSIDERDELVCENIGPKGEMSERWITGLASPKVKPKQSHISPGRINLIQSETKLKSIILSPFRKKRSTDELELETKRQTLKHESKMSSEFLQELKEDIEAVARMRLSRHVSFNILQEATELPSSEDLLKKDKFEKDINLDEAKDKDEEREKYKEGIGEKNNAEEEK
ncbi:cation channel sperm-associated targeting subunit tau-like [Phascolarctos cinereus]|uniref:Amyotrophic lateral sclerosis 2 chromosomal region candidate gene 11 protein-like n=1 Tax=Phascolarctos cinereus TaxID=38626 RepID=A0A6P5JSK1_PHACI|nr:amyotrophic lateral sclerosis 2 chromosomal region candidate gene 11 protein-like [Phascolarctos cinereus]